MSALAVCLLASPACRPARDDAASKPQAVEKSAKRGPIEVVVRADAGQVPFGDRIRLTLQVTAPEGIEIVLPQSAETVGEFRVASVRDYPNLPVPAGRQWRREYELNTEIPGEFEIPALTVRYADRRKSGETPTTQASQPAAEIDSPALPVSVASALAGEFKPSEFSDIKGPVELPFEFQAKWLWWAAAVAALLIVLIAGLRLRSRRKPAAAVEPVVAPDVWAREQLRRLRQERLVEQGFVSEFYFRLTGIVRVYIEKRFAVRAAEQTTEEFLAAAKNHPALGMLFGRLLADFLQAADLVKFARYLPGTAEIERAFATAEAFIDQKVEPMPAGESGGTSAQDAYAAPRPDGRAADA